MGAGEHDSVGPRAGGVAHEAGRDLVEDVGIGDAAAAAQRTFRQRGEMAEPTSVTMPPEEPG